MRRHHRSWPGVTWPGAFRSILRWPSAIDDVAPSDRRPLASGASSWRRCGLADGHADPRRRPVALVVFVLTLVVGRVVAESGLLFVQYKCWPHRFAESVFGSLLTARTHALIHFATIAPTMDAREGLTPYAFNSARMADAIQHLRRRRWLFGLWVLSLILALVIAGATQLHIIYDRGAVLGDEFAGKILPEQTYNSSSDCQPA
jgi:hypothetical protein